MPGYRKRKFYGRRTRRKYRKAGLSYSRKRFAYGRRYRKNRFARAVKKVILKTAEPKHRTVFLTDIKSNVAGGADTLPNPVRYKMLHNGITIVRIINNVFPDAAKHPLPGRGVQDTQRIGDQINASGIMLKMVLDVGSQYRTSTFRVFYCESEQSDGAIEDYQNLFENTTGLTMQDKLNNDRFRLKPIGTYRIQSADQDIDEPGGIVINKWIPFKRKLTFTGSNDDQDHVIQVSKGMKDYLDVVILPWHAISSGPILDPHPVIGSFRATATLHWKDP